MHAHTNHPVYCHQNVRAFNCFYCNGCCLGPCEPIVMGAVLHGGKNNQGGVVQVLGCLRHRDPLMCFHGNLARYFCMRFVINGEEFPDLDNWLTRCLWKGRPQDLTTNMCYRTFADKMSVYIKAAGIRCREVTHLCRKVSARHMDAAPLVDTQVSGWLSIMFGFNSIQHSYVFVICQYCMHALYCRHLCDNNTINTNMA
jgi:Centromere DNA-binding protein complex CBF3 subunit, domain 2